LEKTDIKSSTTIIEEKMPDTFRDSFREIDSVTALDRALRYPYDLPEKSYTFHKGVKRPLPDNIQDHIQNRIAVIGYGSNSASEALDRKYRDFSDLYEDSIPVLRGSMRDYAVVYAAQFSTYGAMPATIHPVLNSELTTYVTFLTESQLERMHDTEDLGLYYSYEKIESTIAFEEGFSIEESFAYVALGGSIFIEGKPLVLEAVKQSVPNSIVLSQREAQLKIIEALNLEDDIEQFIVDNALNEDLRNQRFKRVSDLIGSVWQHTK
jgi:hypothetical protein